MSTLGLRLLLRTWPRSFRAAHGRAAQGAAVDAFRHARHLRGLPLALLLTAPRLVLDLVVTALRLRKDQLLGSKSPDPLRHLPRPEKNPLDNLLQDIRYSARYLFRTPAVTGVAVAALALGIGANTLVFSLINGILLQPLPLEEPDRLVRLYETNLERGWHKFSVSPVNYRDWKEQTSVFTSMSGLYGTTATVTGGDEPIRIAGALVADDFFQTTGSQLALGRGFNRDEHTAGTNAVVVIGPELWHRRFGGQADVLGQTMIIDGSAHSIVGVLADSTAAVPNGVEIWAPMDLDQEYTAPRGAKWWGVVGRMKPEVTVQQASDDLQLVAARLNPEENGWSAVAAGMHGEITSGTAQSFRLLSVAVSLVLLIACANVANLLLARSGARTRELSLRNSLGAPRSRLFRQMITESLVLALMGAVAGAGVALAGLATVRAYAGDTLPRMAEVRLDPTVLLFTLTIGLVTGLVFGVVPAMQGMRVTPSEALKAGNARSGQSRGRSRLRGALVIIEVALAVTVIAGAGLLTRSLIELQSVDPGFEVAGRVSARVALPAESYPDRPSRGTFYDGLLDALRALPATTNVGAVSQLPMGGDYTVGFGIVGTSDPNEQNRPSAELRAIDSGYFASMGIAMQRGRGILDSDTVGTEQVVVVNEAFVERHFPDSEPIGAVLDIGFGSGDPDESSERRIVGVVANIKTFSLRGSARPTYYLSRHQAGMRNMSVVLETSLPSAQAFSQLRATVHDADPNLALYQVRTLEEVVHQTTAGQRLRLGLISSFALLAIVLSGIGIYGMLSFGVAQRRQEIGLRLAIGAAPSSILRLILRGGIGLTLAGVLLGSGGALLLGRALASQLYGISPYDPITLVAVGISLLLVAATACWIPARRATRVDPATTLRAE